LNIPASSKVGALTILLCVAVLEARQDRVDNVGITAKGPPIVKLALPEFRPTTSGDRADKLAKVFNDILWADLDFSGNIELSSRSFYPTGVFAVPGDIKVEDWTAPGVGAKYIAYGSLSITATAITATGRLRDLGAQQDSFGSNFPGSGDEDAARLVAHNLADRILVELGFGRSIFRTQISFVSNRSGAKEIYMMEYDGTGQHALTANGSISITPSWSPADDRIAYTVWRPGPQVAITSAIGARHSFTQVTGVANSTPSWSGDGKSIVYSSRRDGNYEIYRADADGTHPQPVLRRPGVLFDPAHADERGENAVHARRRELDEGGQLDDAQRVRVLGQRGEDPRAARHRPDAPGVTTALLASQPRRRPTLSVHRDLHAAVRLQAGEPLDP